MKDGPLLAQRVRSEGSIFIATDLVDQVHGRRNDRVRLARV